ncbi:hypothetical protein H4R19_001511 [Coemansia spiralis]|nr:hypothetical protein H4R19_001511 [Coemansia spiralis]
MSAPGLQGAAGIKLWIAGLCAGSAVAMGGGASWRAALARLRVVPQLTRRRQVWRLVTTQLGFPTVREALMGALLLYQLRVLERAFGSRRFAAFVFVCAVVGQTLCVGMLLLAWALWPRALAAVNIVAGGPYVLLFACLHQLHAQVPAAAETRVLGVDLGDKWLADAAAASLLVARLPSALAPALAGVAASMVYSADVAGLQQWRFPRCTEAVARRWVGPLLEPRRPPRTRDAPSAPPPPPPPPPPVVVPDELIDRVLAMFPAADRAQVVQALQAAGGDGDRAAAVLLDSHAMAQ